MCIIFKYKPPSFYKRKNKTKMSSDDISDGANVSRMKEIRNNEKTNDLCETYSSPHSTSVTTCWIDMTVMERGQEIQRTWTIITARQREVLQHSTKQWSNIQADTFATFHHLWESNKWTEFTMFVSSIANQNYQMNIAGRVITVRINRQTNCLLVYLRYATNCWLLPFIRNIYYRNKCDIFQT